MTAMTVTPKDRLSFTLFLAASIHAAVILGVTFTSEILYQTSPTIEVTLSQYSDEEAPEDADFIAQSNQIGSGSADDVLEQTTLQDADFETNEYQEVIPDPMSTVPETTLDQRELLTTISATEDQVTAEDVVAEEQLDAPLDAANKSYDELAKEIASLEARIAMEKQELARRPRVKRLTSVSTKSAAEAAYLNMWRQKVERIGNANYPTTSVFGALRMLVIIRQDGTLKEVRILDSSGHKILDDAAMRIVRLAAPYQDFTVDMRKQYDQLEIIRTWQFSSSGNRLGT